MEKLIIDPSFWKYKQVIKHSTKVGTQPKPFKSGKLINTVSGFIDHPIRNEVAFTFFDDDSYVSKEGIHLYHEEIKTLEDLTIHFKEERNFDVSKYLWDKRTALLHWLIDNKIDSVVIGLSGGIDSSVVFKMFLNLLDECKNSGYPLKKVLGVFCPINGDGVTGQQEAKRHIQILLENTNSYNCFKTINLTSEFNSITMDQETNSWSNGQFASVLRTPIFYYQAAVLQSQGFRSLVVGTTNYSEGGYIGFYGKASDGMVDLQPISDIYKSEVIKIAKYYKLPDEIINRKPTGDVHDGKNDEEMIGAPYWFIELYQEMLFKNKLWYFYYLNKDEQKIFKNYMENIENLHNKNKHKYQVGSPAHHIDIMQRTKWIE